MNAKTKQKRADLAATSKLAQQAVKMGMVDSVNEFLITSYKKESGNLIFHTFRGWKEKGFSVQKGEKSFSIWGSPRKGKADKNEEKSEENSFSFFPLCNLFGNKQVEKTNN